MPAQSRFVVGSSRWKLLKLLGYAVIFVAMGIAFVTRPDVFDIAGPGFVTFIGWACIAFFGFGIVILAIQLVQDKAELIIDRAGITYPKYSADVIAWHDIADIGFSGVASTRFVTIQLADPEKAAAGGAKSAMMSLSRGLTGGELSIPLSSANKSLDEVMAAIAQYRGTAVA
jgi:hypothetical protein